MWALLVLPAAAIVAVSLSSKVEHTFLCLDESVLGRWKKQATLRQKMAFSAIVVGGCASITYGLFWI